MTELYTNMRYLQYGTLQKLAELFGKVRSGQVRFLLGSTQKMGAGTNVQDRLIALHHLDVPWRPLEEKCVGQYIKKLVKLVEISLFNKNMNEELTNKKLSNINYWGV